MKSPSLLLAGLLGFLAVALGAFGAHALKAQLVSAGFYETWQTASHYHLIHAVALLVLALAQDITSLTEAKRRALAWAYRFTFAGTLLFSGSLYALCLSSWKNLGIITPFGGLLLLAGWAFVLRAGFVQQKESSTPA